MGLADEMSLAIYRFKTSFNPRTCRSDEVVDDEVFSGVR